MTQSSSDLARDPVLTVRNLRVEFATLDGVVSAVRDVSFTVPRGATLALVGESGSGKSVTSYAILRLIRDPGRIAGGSVLFHPRPGETVDLTALSEKDPQLYRVRGGQISMIFQEPMTALSPVHTVGNQVCEAILLHRNVTPRQAEELAVEALAKVGIPSPRDRLKQYPFEFSGGMRQRVVIAMALVCQPQLVIADEPTTALDVTVQAQILRLIDDLRREMGTSVLFITHDLGVVAQVADEVAVMRKGRIVERADVRTLFRSPLHPYTRQLLAAVPHVGFEGRSEELARPASLPAALPAGYGIEEPNPHPAMPGRDPLVHRFDNGHELLVWPAVREAGF